MTHAEPELQRSWRHELRTPVNHIIGYSEMLLDEAEDLNQRSFIPDLQRIREAGKQLLALINDWIDPVRATALQTNPELMRYELRTLLNAIIGYGEMLQEEAIDRGQEQFIPDLQRIRDAASRLLVLASGSLDFLKGEIDQLDHAVETSAIPVARHEGIVATLPHGEQSATCSQEGHGSLLIVDDNEGNRDLLFRRLTRQGYTVSVAENGRQALERIKAEPFDLVLLDILMPEMNGYQVLEHLKADDRLRHIPVIVLSALGELDSVVTCIELGAEDYLPTPFDPVLLRARISSSLEKKRLREQEVLYLQHIAEEKQRSEAILQVRLAEAMQELRAMHAQIIEKEKLERELQVARRIQHMLLPKQVPTLPGWQVAAYYQPARAVGGDFYDFLPLPDGRLGLVVGDATDKGVPAALVMATTRSILRGVAEGLYTPGEVLGRVNDLLHPDMPPNMFVTCLYAILDPFSGRLHYANSGHDLPYRRHGGGVAELRATGMPLGLLPGMHYEEKEIVLLPGETVLLYSDGLVEAHNPQREMFGFPRLQQLMAQCPANATLIDVLLSELARFTGSNWEQEDDITLVMLQRSA